MCSPLERNAVEHFDFEIECDPSAKSPEENCHFIPLQMRAAGQYAFTIDSETPKRSREESSSVLEVRPAGAISPVYPYSPLSSNDDSDEDRQCLIEEEGNIGHKRRRGCEEACCELNNSPDQLNLTSPQTQAWSMKILRRENDQTLIHYYT